MYIKPTWKQFWWSILKHSAWKKLGGFLLTMKKKLSVAAIVIAMVAVFCQTAFGAEIMHGAEIGAEISLVFCIPFLGMLSAYSVTFQTTKKGSNLIYPLKLSNNFRISPDSETININKKRADFRPPSENRF